MTNRYLIIFSGCVWLWLAACAGQKKAGYDFPVSMNEVNRAKYTSICDRGQILYNLNCGSCHTVSAKRKKIIPDFTQDQLSRYDLKANNRQHDSSMAFVNVTPEELSEIYLFLTYKEKSNIPAFTH